MPANFHNFQSLRKLFKTLKILYTKLDEKLLQPAYVNPNLHPGNVNGVRLMSIEQARKEYDDFCAIVASNQEPPPQDVQIYVSDLGR